MTSAVQIKLTTLEYEDPAFGWYELYADQTHLALGAVVAGAAFNEIEFANAFIHAALTPGDTWYYWVRAAYLDRTSGAITYGTLAYLGSILITGGGGSPYIVGPGSAVDSDFVQFDGTTGKLAKDGGISLDTDTALAANSDSHIASQKAVKAYIAAQAYTDEKAQDAIAALLVAGANITLTYNDGANTLTIDASGGYTDEQAQDAAAALIQNGTGISWSYNDGANTLTPTVSLAAFSTTNLSEGSNLYFTDERAQDAVGAALTDTATIDFTYNDGANTITADIKAASVTEAMQVLANNTTNNVSTTKHGYAPILPNDSTKYLDGTGNYTVPPGSGSGGGTDVFNHAFIGGI